MLCDSRMRKLQYPTYVWNSELSWCKWRKITPEIEESANTTITLCKNAKEQFVAKALVKYVGKTLVPRSPNWRTRGSKNCGLLKNQEGQCIFWMTLHFPSNRLQCRWLSYRQNMADVAQTEAQSVFPRLKHDAQTRGPLQLYHSRSPKVEKINRG